MKARIRAAAAVVTLLVLVPSCSRLPPDTPTEGVGRAVAKTESPAPDGRIWGMEVTDEPAYPAVDDGTTAEIDLTDLNAAALYATVGKMKGVPDEYVGKTIRMAGLFSSEETKTGRRFYCSVPDAAGCCLESLELREVEERRYPEDYPEEGAVITVTGVFGSERVNEYLSYSHIDGARILWN